MKILASLSLILSAGFASAQTSDMIAQNGLEHTQAALAAQPDRTANDQFALGAIQFLRGIERSLQFRWQHNMAIKDFDMPVLRLPVPPNPDAAPFTPDLIVALFDSLRDDMVISAGALDAVSGDVGLEIDLLSIWFDVNMNGARDKGEGLVEYGLNTMMSPRQAAEMQMQGPDSMLIRFDTADVAWLNAYANLLAGISEMVIAFDPTEAITKVLESNQAMINIRGIPESRNNLMNAFLGRNWIDQFAMVYGALNQQPDAIHTRAARQHFLAMIAQNKVFWAAVAAETDNDHEWIPNPAQVAALGFTLPEGAAESWQAILADAEMLLNGDLLVTHWRLEPVGGINIKEMFENPPVVDIVDWFQGAGLVPYMQRGPVVTDRNMRQFERMMSGDTLLYALMFN